MVYDSLPLATMLALMIIIFPTAVFNGYQGVGSLLFAFADLPESVLPEQCLTLQGRGCTMAPFKPTKLRWKGKRERENMY